MASDRPDEATIFNKARRIDSVDERRAWLDEACASDGELRNRVEKLLAAFAEQSQFLEHPAEELRATLLVDPNVENLSAALEAGLAPAFGEGHAVVIGSAAHSVLQSLGNTIDLPRVALRESHAEGADPITRPQSTEMPARDAHSRYQLQGEIARGGMGAILKGRDTDLGRDLAIKVLLDEHKTRPEVIQRFVEEAQIGGQLQHPGIAPVYELGQFSDKRPFFSMKLVKGQTLSKLLADREDPTNDRGRFLGIFEQVCQTMAYAHSRGVIHRDLKPANIMVGAFGEVQVMDWGLAKVLSAGGVADEKKSHQKQSGQSIIQTLRSVGSDSPGTFGTVGSQTQIGSVMGTPAYMPPEQALGEIDHLDERADVFGLGAILCEILTDKPPYVADDATLVFRMASRGKLEDCYHRLETCGADAELVALTKHCLELEPADRPRNAGVLAERITRYLESVQQKLHETELERAAQEARADAEAAQAAAERRRAEAEAASAQAERKRRRTSLALAASVLLLVGLGSGGWLYLLRQEADRQTAEADAQRRHAGEMQSLAEQRDEQRKAADHERNLARNAEVAMEKTAAKATREREIAERESYRSNIRLAESMLQGDELARYRVATLLWETQPELRGWEWGYLMAQCPLEEWSLQTNQGGLVTMAASADGRFLATAGADGSVALWETRSRKELWRHKNIAARDSLLATEAVEHVSQICIDPLARWIAVDFQKYMSPSFKILNFSDGEFVTEGSETRFSGIAFSATGQELYLLKYDQLIRYATDTWKPLASIRLSSFDERNLFVDAAGTVVGVQDRIARPGMKSNRDRFLFLDPRSLQPITALDSLNTPVSLTYSFADPVLDSRRGILLFDEGLKQATSRSLSTTIQATTSPIENELVVRGGRITHLAYDARTDSILVANQEGTVLISDADRKTRTMAHGTPIRGLANLSDGRFVTGGSDGLIKCWTLRSPAPLGTNVTAAPTGATAAIVDFTHDGNQLFFMSWEDQWCYLCDVNSLANHQQIGTQSLTVGDRFLGAIRPTTNEILVRNRGQVSLYASKTGGLGEKTRSIPPIGWPRAAVAFDAKGRLMVALDPSGKVAVYDLNTDRNLPVPDVRGSRFLAIAPSGKRVAVHNPHGLHVWDTSTARLIKRLEIPAPPDSVDSSWHLYVTGYRPCFHPDEELLAVLEDGDGHVSRIVIGDVSTGERRMEIVAEPGVQFLRFLFTPDGNRLVVPCSDSKVRIFDWRIGKELVALTNTLVNLALAISPDGRSIAYGGHAPALRIAKALPRSVETRPNEDFYSAVAELRHYSSQFAESNATVKRANGDSNLAVQSELLGDVLWHRGKPVEAIAQYTQAVKLMQRAILTASDSQKQEERLAETYGKWLAAVAPQTRDEIIQQAVDFWKERSAGPQPHPISRQMLAHFQLAQFNLRLTENQEAAVAILQSFIEYWQQQAGARSDDRYMQGVLIALTTRLIDTDLNETVARFLCEGADKYPPGVAARIADRFLARPEVAVSFCSSAISTQSKDGHLFVVRGQAHAALGQTDQAIADLKQALELQPVAQAAGLLADLLLIQSCQQKWPAQFVRIGRENEASGLRMLESGTTDTVTEPATIDGQDCRQVLTRSKFGYAYFIIDEQFKKSTTKMDAIVEMEYWDDGTGVFSIQYDTSADAYRRSAEKQSLTGARQWRTARFTLKNAQFANSQNGRSDFRVEVEGEGLHLRRVSLQRVHQFTDIAEPWARLAAACHVIEDQQTLTHLLKQQPAAAAGIADIHLANQEWALAIDVYDTAIKELPKDANLLSHRAKAYAELGKWELARADWLQAIKQDPDQVKGAFELCRRADRWSEAAEFGQMFATQNPKDTVRWMQVAPILVLAGDQKSSTAFCKWILAQPFIDLISTERTIKACLLQPGLVNPSDLPGDILATALDEGTVAWFQPWGWGTSALLAYRSGDPQSAVKYAAQSEELTRDDFVHAFNLAILALSHHQLQHPDEARQALDEAAQLIGRLQKNVSYKGHHDLLIAEILYREAEATMAGKDVNSTLAESDSSATPGKKTLPSEPPDQNDPKKD